MSKNDDLIKQILEVVHGEGEVVVVDANSTGKAAHDGALYLFFDIHKTLNLIPFVGAKAEVVELNAHMAECEGCRNNAHLNHQTRLLTQMLELGAQLHAVTKQMNMLIGEGLKEAEGSKH